MGTKDAYYLPQPSYWPIVGSVGLFFFMLGLAHWLHGDAIGPYFFGAGFLVIIYMLFGWFSTVIHENLSGCYNPQVDRSFRWGMCWFIFSEVMFFAAFFGALFYARVIAIPELAGPSDPTHLVLWPSFKSFWPLLKNPNNTQFVGPHSVMETWGLPAINTLILLTSGATVTWAHWGLKKQKHWQLVLGLGLTVLLGISFLTCQVHEYIIAYTEKGLTLASGIYGTTFFMLTGFHGLHVTIGTIMLIVIFFRALKHHFSPDNHFAFEAVSWYWHFVDVVWLLLFVFVYWL